MKSIPKLLVASFFVIFLSGCDIFVSEAPTVTPTPVATPIIIEDDSMMDEMDSEMSKFNSNNGEKMDEKDMSDKDDMKDSTIKEDEMNDSASDENKEEVSNVSVDDKFKPYSESSFASDVSTGRNILMFSASWCPTCQLTKRDIAANFGDIPDDVTIYEADYDTETELKAEYGVVIQDTMVLVDNDGNEIKKWTTQGRGVDAVLDNLV